MQAESGAYVLGEGSSRDFAASLNERTGERTAMNLPGEMPDVFERYGLALVLAGFALFLRGILPLPDGTAIFQLPIAAVVLSAWYGGRGPSVFASLVSATGLLYWFVPPRYSFDLSQGYALALFIFVLLCVALSEFSAGRRRTEHALRASEERFRTLVQFSSDVYWETNAGHRFTRQEFSERLPNAPAGEAEIGETRADGGIRYVCASGIPSVR